MQFSTAIYKSDAFVRYNVIMINKISLFNAMTKVVNNILI